MRDPQQRLEDAIRDDVRRALAEDLGSGDLTAALIPPGVEAEAMVLSRDSALICGRPWFDAVFAQLDNRIRIDWAVAEGERVRPNQRLCTLYGPAQPLLSGERSALNFLQTLSGVATTTQQFVQVVADSGVRLLDTRKTVPGLRQALKYAVRIGGGHNHRHGLFDAILIKENHIVAAGSIGAAVAAARSHAPHASFIEVEVESLHQVHEALAAGAERMLLDNMGLDEMREAVDLVAGRAELEASGGVTQAQLKAIAETGVDFISVGALTKHIQAIDLSMRFTYSQG